MSLAVTGVSFSARTPSTSSVPASVKWPRRSSDLRLLCGAGDGNRTRTINLGICAIRAVVRPDLRSGCPRVTVTDPSLPRSMVRRTGVWPALMAAPWSSLASSIAAIPRAAVAVSWLAKRPRSGVALTRQPRPRQSSSEEDGILGLHFFGEVFVQRLPIRDIAVLANATLSGCLLDLPGADGDGTDRLPPSHPLTSTRRRRPS